MLACDAFSAHTGMLTSSSDMPTNALSALNRHSLMMASQVGKMLGELGWSWLVEFTGSARTELAREVKK